ncbi:DedA family protein [Streptomyces aidingensis]|uniref:Membrane protein DedA, SNARE-associated domain n=1 Tax=Streptomyces aidingensis TaxID=910347 RepID=A0A1I1SLA4_9ACTN|nr:DedA family protein [Streptomyces aidingensis]SFD47254.1 membrane protein DedA, SNARE-associated domain [Streptomyces aidingensis]
MDDAIIRAVEELVSTPWVYLALYGLAALDAFFPVVPSESLVITLAVFAAAEGRPHPVLIVCAAAVGAFTGDHISYAIGRRAGARVFRRIRPGSRRQRVYDRVGLMLRRRGGLVIVVARYIPGGRTAATLTTGAVGYPRRSFTRYDAVAAVTWAVYSAGLGFLGGAVFRDEPVKGLLLGLGLALALTAGHEAVRALVVRRRGGEHAGPEA